ncbi:uncharacterized protein EV420DRAFT_702556 [Desarmillaria tabescens]|uniref:Uncharacterized protein n=1 Tax=Armillaria tabescens TaxID=1929756 RepID=A0AA39K286_ARMTA|nr:uncharacterized protein EV420DRAFT_702556 [Desarmillaria tabescens]KAK0452006.1 hypothetical protein EV420DRAFT_702556 [Desarmillaria tabescens]
MGIPYSQDIEEALTMENIGLSSTSQKFSSEVILDGQKLNKAHALAIRSKHHYIPTSTNQLQRVAGERRFAHSHTSPMTIIGHQSTSSEPSLMLSEPITTLVYCEKNIFLAVAEVVDIHLNLDSLEKLPLDLLKEDTSTVTYQIVDLIPTTQDDDPSLKSDWHSTSHLQPTICTVPGHLIQPINPILSTAKEKPFYLFSSDVLMTSASSLIGQIHTGDIKRIPTVCNEHADGNPTSTQPNKPQPGILRIPIPTFYFIFYFIFLFIFHFSITIYQ